MAKRRNPSKGKRKKTKSRNKKAQPTPEWRKLEELVQLIEQAMSGTGATITSPGWLPDKITGISREVDVLIRSKVGSSPIVVAFECRRRGRTADALWVEQVVTKHRDIGVDKSILVARHFNKPAKSKAARYGVEIREIRQFSESDGQPLMWLRAVMYRWNFNLASLGLMVYGDYPHWLNDELQSRLAADPIHTPFLLRPDGKLTALADILNEYDTNINLLIEGVPPETNVPKQITRQFNDGDVCVRSSFGDAMIKEIEMCGNFNYKSEITPAHSYSQYANDKEILAGTGHIRVPINDKQVAEFVIIHGPKTSATVGNGTPSADETPR